jgi:signal transduction histidine kinase
MPLSLARPEADAGYLQGYPAHVGLQIAEQLRVASLHAQKTADESTAARSRLAFLFKASQQLATSLEPATTMRALAELVVPELGDGSVVRVLDGAIARTGTEGVCPREWRKWLERLTRPDLKRALQDGASQVGSTCRTRRPSNPGGCADLEYMIVPLRARRRTLGTLTIFSLGIGRRYGRDELAVGEALGLQAGLALDNARLYEQRAILDCLGLARGQLDAVQNERLRDDERKRIARDLHDHVEQAFFAIGLTATNALARRGGQVSEASLTDALARTAELANSGAEQLRATLFALNHTEFAEEALVSTLFNLVRSFHQRTGVEADLALTGRHKPVPEDVAEVLHALAREALLNVERHARAGAVVLALHIGQQSISLSVHDDGAGSSALVLKQIAHSATHFGLQSLRARVRLLHGSFVAGRGPDGGFLVRARIPLQFRPTA